MEPTQAQIREFWEWCGFEKVPLNSGWKEGIYKHPFDGTGHGIVDRSYDFLPPVDLNSLFRYAVPKVIGLHGHGHPLTVTIVSGWGDTHGDYGVEITKDGKRLSLNFNQDPALALFWAINKVRCSHHTS